MIGNGNVAIDVARMLVLSDAELRVTDVADHALEAFRASAVREVLIIGRRGPAQAAFTNPEVLELGELRGADVHVDPAEAQLDELSARWLEDFGDKTHRVNVETSTGYAAARGDRRRAPHQPALPRLAGRDPRPRARRGDRARAQRHRRGRRAARRARTGETETIPVGLVFRSIGYRGVPLAGLPFDDGARRDPQRRRARHRRRRRARSPGLYVAGWIKRGPSGVIGTNKQDGVETAKALLEDAEAGAPRGAERRRRRAPGAARRALPGRTSSFAGWQAIDEVERAAGEPQGRPRVKLVRREELNGAARGVAR